MPTHNLKNAAGEVAPGGAADQPKASSSKPKKPDDSRERLRDIIVVIVTYPLTPTERTNKLAEKKPWLEFISLLLKVALAMYAIYEAASAG